MPEGIQKVLSNCKTFDLELLVTVDDKESDLKCGHSYMVFTAYMKSFRLFGKEGELCKLSKIATYILYITFNSKEKNGKC